MAKLLYIRENPVIGFLIRTLFFACIFFVFYYVFFLGVEKIETTKLEQAKEILTHEHSTLVSHRLAVVALAKIDPLSPTYEFESQKLIEDITLARRDLEKIVSEQKTFPTSRRLNSTQHKILTATAKKRQKNLEIVAKIVQKSEEVEKKLTTFHEKTQQLSSYLPQDDLRLGTQLKPRAEATKNGIEKLKNDFPELRIDVEQTQQTLQKLAQTGSQKDTEVSIQMLDKLKTTVHAQRTKLLTEEPALSMLVEETKLLYDYQALQSELEAAL